MSKDKALDIVLSEFLELAKVPRPSHHEERVSEYLFQWAKRHGLAVEKDNMNEIIIDKPAFPGCENVPRVIFQAHMDMVCVCEEGVTYDPMNDPIKVINDGVTLTADCTSLGADDGIGVAMCLYLLQDDTLRHGPIRAIFTTNEEDGMDSMDIDPKYLWMATIWSIWIGKRWALCVTPALAVTSSTTAIRPSGRSLLWAARR